MAPVDAARIRAEGREGFRIAADTLDFNLPDDLIAQDPLTQRDQARLLVLDRSRRELDHRSFADLTGYLRAGDLLVLNAARVNPAKLVGRKATGGRVEIILLAPLGRGAWKALARPFLKDGAEILFAGEARATVAGRFSDGEYRLQFGGGDPGALMSAEGRLPLPPYIKRAADDPRHALDRELYQTVYAKTPGSVAAPTAGLHFTDALLAGLRAKGIEIATLVLHVGWGTFRPIAARVQDHRMLSERYEIRAESAAAIARARRDKRRIVAVGTTCTRVLESLPDDFSGEAASGETDLFIRPGFGFRWVGGLITNFHVPRSTPVALTAAFAGMERLESAYADAIHRRYRFFSYGDAMLIL